MSRLSMRLKYRMERGKEGEERGRRRDEQKGKERWRGGCPDLMKRKEGKAREWANAASGARRDPPAL